MTDREPPESEPAEPAETDTGGEPIESGSMTGGTDIGGEPVEPGDETGEPIEPDPGTDEPGVGSVGTGAGAVDLTPEDEGKDVVDESGEPLGTVADVEDGTIHVDPDSGIADDRMDEFGWDDREAGTQRVGNDRVREVTVTEVVIVRL